MTSLFVFIGLSKTGPSPSRNLTPKPMASGIVKMSENKIAASKLKASIGCIANSQHTSGFLHISRKFLKFFLTALYSGI